MRRRVSPEAGVADPFEMIQRDKESLAVDIRHPEGNQLVRSLIECADVVVENFRPGTLAKYGLDAESIRSAHPRIVYASISGYGQTGPLAQEGGVDLVAQGHAGLLSVTGDDGGDIPAKAGFPVADLGSAMWCAIGVVGALHRRTMTGIGATVDVALTDSLLAWAVWEVAELQMTGSSPGRLGHAHRLTAPYQAFKCADEWITVAALDTRWPAFCRVMGSPELLDDPRFTSETARFAHRKELEQILARRFESEPVAWWVAELRATGIPCGPVNTLATALTDAQFAARDMVRRLGSDGGSIDVLNSPIKSDGVLPVRLRAPRLGAHTRSILAGIGLDDAHIDQLAAEGVILCGEPSDGASGHPTDARKAR
jgi:crotonobetainyl-CoA:carnitine CoA-transferase CaiB-like acyl-CoA transferase